MTTLSEEQLNELSEQLRDYTLEDLLLICIRDTGVMDTVCMLDLMVQQTGQRIAMFNWKGRTFPAETGDLAIPVPEWQQDLRGGKKATSDFFPLIPELKKKEEADVIFTDDETDRDAEKNSLENPVDQPEEASSDRPQGTETNTSESGDREAKNPPGGAPLHQTDCHPAKPEVKEESDGSSK